MAYQLTLDDIDEHLQGAEKKGNYQLSLQDIDDHLNKNGISKSPSSAVKNNSLLHKLGSAVEPFNEGIESSGLPNLAANLVSAVPKTLRNITNFPHQALGIGPELVKLPGWLPSESKNLKDTPTARAMGSAGDVLGNVLMGGSVYGLLNRLMGVNAATPLLGRAASGGLSGGVTTDSDQPGGRLAGAALGALAPLAHGVTNSAIGQRAAEIARNTQQTYRGLYNQLTETAHALPGNIRVPSVLENMSENVNKLFQHTPTKFNASVRRFGNNPTFENAHKAQSDLGKIIGDLGEKRTRGHTLSSGENDAYQAAINLQRRIRGSIQQFFTNANRGDLADHYGELTHGYREEAVPFRQGSQAGTDAEYAKQLLKSERFANSQMAAHVPGYQARRAINKAMPYIGHYLPHMAITAGAGIGIPYAILKLLEGKS